MSLMLRTDQVAAGDRIEFWRAAMRTGLGAECRIEPGRSGPFVASMCVLPCGPLTLVEMSGSSFKTTRLGPGLQAQVSIKVQLDGHASVGDRRRIALLAPGDACLVPPDREIVAERTGAFRQVLVNVPQRLLDRCAPRWREQMATTFEASRPQAAPAAQLLRYVMDHRELLDDASRERLATTAMHLLAGLLGGAVAHAAGPAGRSRMAGFQRQRAERFILEHLRDPDLSVDMVARELGLSRRYLHKLFDGNPPGVMQWALVQRLQACRSDIAQRRGRSIGEVAYGWGFNSLSHFSRVFKQHFGMRPTDV